MSTPNSKLLFFDREGYPYNLTFDEATNQWSGKIYFDENSSDTFRTVCLYIFEKVDAFDFSDVFNLASSQLFNYSGITFVSGRYTGETITNIQKVNSSPLFHSKWIYGQDFDKKFPIGAVVKLNNITGTTATNITDFNASGTTYYNVLGSKKGAVLINTYTNNKDFDYIFTGGTISSLNVIKVPDYANQGLVDLDALNYYNGKKLSIVDTINNDGVYTYDTYSILKNKICDFLLPATAESGTTLRLEFDLMTQRPELYEGPINISYINGTDTGTIIEFHNYINTNIDFVTTGQTIIFENPDGSPIHQSNPEFKITGFIDREEVITDSLSFIKREGTWAIQTTSDITYTGLTYNDYIEVIATPNVIGGTLHDKRQFQVLNVTANEIQVREYLLIESGYTYKINKVINPKKVKKLYAIQNGVPTPDTFSGYTVCYSTNNRISMTQSVLPSGNTTYFFENTIAAMRNKYASLLNRYGLNFNHYHSGTNNYFVFDGLEYHQNDMGYESYYNNILLDVAGTILSSGGTFTSVSGGTEVDSNVYFFIVDEQFPATEKVYFYETTKLAKNNLVEIGFDIQRDNTNYGFNLALNNVDYFISLASSTGTTSGTTTYTEETINSFVSTYGDILHKKGFTVYYSTGYTEGTTTGHTLIIEGQQPNINILDIEIRVNHYSAYSVLRRISDNSIVIDSSELQLVDTGKSLFDYSLATGMILNITGATHDINNKQYNTLRLEPTKLQLSYQGPFLEETSTLLSVAVDSFLRAPRGSYLTGTTIKDEFNIIPPVYFQERTIQYRLSWEPIEGNNPQISPDIFFYDYSGSQLKDNGLLTYVGPKPLWDSTSNNLIFLNREPNSNIEMVSNPEYQQTVFDRLSYELEAMNDTINYNYIPVPMQVFVGFNSKLEGVVQNNLLLEKIDNVIFSGTTKDITITGRTYETTVYNKNFIISTGTTGSYIECITEDPYFDFTTYGFEPLQHITLSFSERTITGHTIVSNYKTYSVTDVTYNKIIVSEKLTPFQTSGKTYNFIIKTEPDLIASIGVYGQTEIEDDRFVQHLKLLGARLDSDVQPIFKESDINEVGIDYTILNLKRKELLLMYPEIYNYIGSYKALINAINFFGYNDLQLYEYYRNIKPSSPLYGQLQKILIEDIFVNSIPGWEEPELDTSNFLKTNLFNLTYQITDFEGNYVEMYSLNEVQQKLTKMVHWLRRNIIPLSSNILDITGVANTRNTLYVNYNASNYVKKITVNQSSSAVNFDYIQTLNIDTNYLFTINFYLASGATMPEYWTAKIKTFHLNPTNNELEPVQYINLYKKDLLSYSFNVDRINEPFMYIETQAYNDYGLGYTNSKLFNYNEGRFFVLVNNNFQTISYRYVTDDYGYYIVDDGRFYIVSQKNIV